MRREPDTLPNEKDYLIAYHIRRLREIKYAGHGGGQKCAEAMKIDKGQYYLWENGSRTPRGENLKKIAAFFGVQVSDFSKKPEGWPEIYAGMLSKRHKKAVVIEGAGLGGESDDNTDPRLPTTREAMAAMEKMNSIITHLLKKQVMLEEGKLNPKEFTKAIEELQGYAMFKLPE